MVEFIVVLMSGTIVTLTDMAGAPERGTDALLFLAKSLFRPCSANSIMLTHFAFLRLHEHGDDDEAARSATQVLQCLASSPPSQIWPTKPLNAAYMLKTIGERGECLDRVGWPNVIKKAVKNIVLEAGAPELLEGFDEPIRHEDIQEIGEKALDAIRK